VLLKSCCNSKYSHWCRNAWTVCCKQDNGFANWGLTTNADEARRGQGRIVFETPAAASNLDEKPKNMPGRKAGVTKAGRHKICEHHRRRSVCRDCGGKGLCVHDKQKHTCKQCNGASLCLHGRQTSKCVECQGTGVCDHGVQRYRCSQCKASKK